MKLPRHILFYLLFGMVLLIVGMAAQNIYVINQTLNRAEQHLYLNTPNSENGMAVQTKEAE